MLDTFDMAKLKLAPEIQEKNDSLLCTFTEYKIKSQKKIYFHDKPVKTKGKLKFGKKNILIFLKDLSMNLA